jgi:hypothetical protein
MSRRPFRHVNITKTIAKVRTIGSQPPSPILVEVAATKAMSATRKAAATA